MALDSMHYDIVIVGAGPAGLSAAIRLKQLALQNNQQISVCIVEKGAEVGAHILSGAVFDPVALNRLIPDWPQRHSPLHTPVTEEHFYLLREKRALELPQFLLPPMLKSRGAYIISLADLCRWLAQEAESLGVEIYPGFAVTDMVIEDNKVCGVITGEMGVAKDGQHKAEYAAGMALYAKYVLIAEGTRGSLTRQLETRFHLRSGIEPQKYGLGIKELWQVAPHQHQPGLVIHTQGWPLDSQTSGGGFVYHLEDNRIAVGFITHLDYQNPYLSPFHEMQRFKTHPKIRPFLEGGKRIAYGARTVNVGGLQSLPQLLFPGGALIGCAAGFLNVPRIKGVHNAMESGMLAAEAVVSHLAEQPRSLLLTRYATHLSHSSLYKELKQVRNIKPAISRLGVWWGTLYAGLDLWIHSLGLTVPWTFRHPTRDRNTLQEVTVCKPILYPKEDNVLTFDRLSSLSLANVYHEENQPSHLVLKDKRRYLESVQRFGGPEQYYCPANVYEVIQQAGEPTLQIYASNCIHCKACDIKDPLNNIMWRPPEGGGGPNYPDM
jgi:electron-transferring-flavoprotein dehydrogenase